MIEMNIKPHEKVLYQRISSCINTFKRMPKYIEYCIENNGQQGLKYILNTANQFAELSNHVVQHISSTQSYVEVFHRFYSRLREIIYSYMGYYIKNNGKILIRDFLIEANKEVLTFRPDSDPTLVLKRLHSCLIKLTKIIAVGQNMKNQQIQTVLKEKKAFAKRPDPPSTKEEPLYLREKGLPKNIQDEINTNNRIKSLGIDIVANLDTRYFQKCTKQEGEELIKSSTLRNKGIKLQISRYSANYDLYDKKPEQKKNRPSSQKSKTRPLSGRKKSLQKNKSRNNSMSLKKKHSLYQSITYDGASDELLRQELMQQISERKKCAPTKVIISGNDLCFKPQYRTMKVEKVENSKFMKRAKKGAKIGFQLYSYATHHNSISYEL